MAVFNGIGILGLAISIFTLVFSADLKFQRHVDNEVFKFNFEDGTVEISEETRYETPVEVEGTPARHCDAIPCKLPKCRCSGDDIPGKIPAAETPQMVILSFQNAVHVTNINLYLDLFEGRKNPNGCPAVGTFFVSSKYSNFYDVQLLHHKRHEIASNGAVESTLPDYWYKATVADWCKQIKDNRQILTKWANIPECDIEGFRTPYLYMGGNTQLQAYKACGVTYDATRVALNYKGDPNLMWPYTYDTMSTQDCPIGVCANDSFPGIWQMPLEALVDPRGVPCAALQGCRLNNEADVYNTLINGFNDRYTRNRAPMMVSIDTAFLLTDYKRLGLEKFLDAISTKDDVFLVSAAQALAWVQNPQPTKHCHCHDKYPVAFNCSNPAPPLCKLPKTCNYDKNRKFVPRGATGIIYVMELCTSRCPGCYPTLGDPLGTRC